MRAAASLAVWVASSGFALAQWSDNFNRPDGPIGGNWTVVSGSWAIKSNRGTHTANASNTVLQHNNAVGANYAQWVTSLDVFANSGTTDYFIAPLIGLGGTDSLRVRLWDQSTPAASFGRIALQHRTGAGWGAWPGTGTDSSPLTPPVTQCRLKVYFVAGGDTLVADLDTDFDGVPDQTYTKSGVLALASNLGTGFGLGAAGEIPDYGIFDNWDVALSAPPDPCASAWPLLTWQPGDTTVATQDGASTCDAVGNDLWYRFTAPATGGSLTLDTCVSSMDTVVTVYSGSCGALTEIACNDDAPGLPCAAPSSALTVLLSPSQEIRVRVSDKGVPGAFVLRSSFVNTPVNDNCSAPTPLSSWPQGGTTVQATNDAPSSCDPGGADVWYSFVAGSAGGRLALDTCAGSMDTVLTVYSGVCGALAEIACNDDATGAPCSGPESSLSVMLAPSQPVLIRVSDKGLPGAFTLTSSFQNLPTNDDCAAAANLLQASVLGFTMLATNDALSPCDPFGNDVWYAYTAPALAGVLTLDTCTSPADTTLSVYDACGGSLLACDDDGAACGGRAAALAVALDPGQRVLIRVSDKGAPGYFRLQHSFGVPACSGSELTTLFASNVGLGSGSCVYFDVDVTNPSGISISQLDTNADTSWYWGPLTLDVYTKSGTYLGFEQTPGAWTLAANGVGMPGPQDAPTTVEFPDFTLPPGRTGFCLVIQNAGHRYSYGTGSNQVYSNADLTLTAGASQSPPWNSPTYTPRVWNGTLRYNCVYGPQSYCTAGTTSHGCLPSIAASADPDVAHIGPCVVTVSHVEGGQNGLLFYGLRRWSVPWCSQGGSAYLCVRPPLERTGVQGAGGSAGACDGTFTLDWSAFQRGHAGALGSPWIVGANACVQCWFRDPPSCRTTSLSNAVEMTYRP